MANKTKIELAEENERLKYQLRAIHHHASGYCFDGATPKCFAAIRDLSADGCKVCESLTDVTKDEGRRRG